MLSKNEMGLLCELFNRGGWVLDFSTNELDTFTLDSVGIPLCEHYRLSKGKSLVAFINEANLTDSQRFLFGLFEHYETRYQCEFESWDDYPHPSMRTGTTVLDTANARSSLSVRNLSHRRTNNRQTSSRKNSRASP